MITRFASLSGRLAVAFAMLFTVVACGGGGGGGGSFLPDSGNTSTYYLAVALLDGNGAPTSEVTTAAPATLRVTVTKNGKNGAPVADVVVSATSSVGVISPASGTALSDAAGIATFRVEADSAARGAGTITVSADSPSGGVTASLAFQIGSDGLRLGYIDADGLFIENEIGIEPGSLLASQAIAQLSMVILDQEGVLAGSAETVSFNSGCLASGQSALDPNSPIIVGDGKVNTSYIAKGCSGNDQITASLEGSTAQAFGTISIASPQANGFTFVSAEPTTIVLRGTGGGGDRSESSTVTFKVVDSNNAPLGGISVDFSLSTYVGGLSLSPPSAVSNSAGLVKVNVFSGDVPTVVRAIATAAAGDGSGQQVSTVSDILTVSTGLPDQDSTSLSVGDGGFVIEDGYTVDGITRTITVRLADSFNNPVPDGTAAIFTTEYGVIEPSCETVGGACDVTWSSSNPRFPSRGAGNIKTINGAGYSCPSHSGGSGPCPDDLGYTRGGRSTVTVTAIGTESFTDRNGNGIMDEDEKDLFTNLPEAFRDYNEDNAFTPALAGCQGTGPASSQCIAGEDEEPFDFNSNGRYDLNRNPAIYNGLQCPLEGDGIWCSRELVNVRDDVVLILSAGPEWDMAVYQGRNLTNTVRWNGGVYNAYISDIFNNRPPAGSTITLTGTGGCSGAGVTVLSGADVQNTTAFGAHTLTFDIVGVGEPGTLTIKLQPDGAGAAYSESFTCVPEPPPDPNDPGLVVGP